LSGAERRGCHPGDPVFAEPWEAKAFALAVALQQQGVFSATEWAEALGQRIREAQALGDPDHGATYYRHWLRALEGLVVSKGLVSAGALSITRDCWDDVARATPHGQPIELAMAMAGD
jgi:nitrile hydratase accessory protein